MDKWIYCQCFWKRTLTEAIFNIPTKSFGGGLIKKDINFEDFKKEMVESILDLISMPGFWS